MNLDQAMRERRSIRGFLDKPALRSLLEEVIALANFDTGAMADGLVVVAGARGWVPSSVVRASCKARWCAKWQACRRIR
jgi:nitroreductase